MLLIELSGARDAETLAAQSKALRASLSNDARFTLVANGEGGLEAFPERLRPYRYLLSPTLDTQRFDAAYLGEQVQSRVADLGSPAAALVEPLVPSDPTLETLVLAESWEPATAPQRIDGVWFDRAGKKALLAVQTRAAGFDPTGQRDAIATLEAAYANAKHGGAAQNWCGIELSTLTPGATTSGLTRKSTSVGPALLKPAMKSSLPVTR